MKIKLTTDQVKAVRALVMDEVAIRRARMMKLVSENAQDPYVQEVGEAITAFNEMAYIENVLYEALDLRDKL